MRREVLACLTHGATPFSLHARLLETAKAEGVLTELGEVLPDVLLDLVLLVRPAPPLLFEYLDVLCLERARYMGENTCDAGRVIVVLLRKINATVDQDTLSTLCQHILDAVGDAPIWTNQFHTARFDIDRVLSVFLACGSSSHAGRRPKFRAM